MNMQFRDPAQSAASPSVFSPRFLIDAIWYGPFGYLKAGIIGFILGGVVSLIVIGTASDPAAIDSKFVLGTCVGGGTALLVCGAVLSNLFDGIRFRQAQELQRSIFSDGRLPPAVPRRDLPGLDLGKPRAPLEAFADEVVGH